MDLKTFKKTWFFNVFLREALWRLWGALGELGDALGYFGRVWGGFGEAFCSKHHSERGQCQKDIVFLMFFKVRHRKTQGLRKVHIRKPCFFEGFWFAKCSKHHSQRGQRQKDIDKLSFFEATHRKTHGLRKLFWSIVINLGFGERSAQNTILREVSVKKTSIN